MRRFAAILFLLAAALPAAAGLTDLDNPGPALTSVSARQRYPWNGLVDVDVSFTGNAGETYRIELSATDKVGGTNFPVRTVWCDAVGCDAIHGVVPGNPVDISAPGTHRLVWNAGADLPAGFVADRVTVTAKLLNPIWSFASIPEIDPDDIWAPETVYHDVQTVAAYGEIEDHEPTIRCLTDEWNLEDSLGSNVVFSGSSMGLRQEGTANPNASTISLWTQSATTNAYRMVTLDYETGLVKYDSPYVVQSQIHGSDIRFFQMRDGRGRIFADLCRDRASEIFLKSSNTDLSVVSMNCRYDDAEHGSAVCGYFPNGIPWSDASSTSNSSYDKGANAAVFFSGEAGTDMKEAIVLCGGSAGVRTTSKYSCMANPVGRYVVPLLDGNTFFTVGYPSDRSCALQNFGLSIGHFTNHLSWDYWLGNTLGVAWSKGVAMPDGERIFLGGAGKSRPDAYGKVRMWQTAEAVDTFSDFPSGHPFEAWNRRDVTCLLPNGKFCGVDEELGLVVVNPLTGETYVASEDPVFKKGKMGCQLLPNGKVWIIPYDCEGREFEAGLALCGKLYEVDFGFTRSFSLSSLCSPYLRVAEGDPEPSGIKVGLDPNGGELPGIYAMYYKGENPVYGELPVPTWTGHTFLGWSTDGTAANLVAATDPVPPLGILLKAAWQAHSYTVKFDANGGSGTMSNQSFTYGVAQALTANAFTRTGYTFTGWATSATGAKVYNDNQSVSNLTTISGGTVNLYAVWTPITYSVKFNANGGSGSMSNESFTYGTAKALTANAFTRTGYTFGGWATSATGAKVYNDKQSVSNLTATSGGTVNLYAVWTKALYMVIDLSGGSSATTYPVSYLSAVPSGGWTDEYKTTKLVLRRIDAGTFTMGSPTGEVGRYANETSHSVTLSKDYFIGVFEVTQRQWELVMGTKPSYFSNASYYAKRPVERLSYNAIRGSSSGAGWPSSSAVDSTSFIGRIRSRTGINQFDLPTEAQWERACRAGTTAAVSNGINLNNAEYDSRIDGVCWHYKDWTIATTSSGTGTTGTNPVGALGANPWGLYDMHGNVWEWCLDWYAENLGTSAVTDPKGASSGTQRIVRSGAWECASYNCRSARRGYEPPSATKRSDSNSDGHFGLRLSCTP